jgi:hypothetical protein
MPIETPTAAKPRRRRAAAAQFLCEAGFPISAGTLSKLASIGGGPLFQSWGRLPMYAEDDLLAWANARLSARLRVASERRRHAAEEPKAARRGRRGAQRSTVAEGGLS